MICVIFFSVGLGVQRSFSEQDWVFFGGDSQFVIEGVVPDFFHIVPVGNDTVFNRVFQGQDTTFALGFITDVAVFLTHTNHDTLMPGAAYNAGEDGTRSIVTGKSSFAHAGAIVNDQSCYFFVAHFRIFVKLRLSKQRSNKNPQGAQETAAARSCFKQHNRYQMSKLVSISPTIEVRNSQRSFRGKDDE